MAENTQVEASPAAPAESAAAPRTNPAPPPTGRASEYLRERPHARIFIIVAVIVLLVGGFLRVALFFEL